MRPSNKSRSRNKPSNNGHNGGQNNNNNNNQRRSMGNIINRVFESAGPDGKVRGTPQQIIDKYQALARDAQVSGDRVVAENYLQHSEHYSRLLGEAQRSQQEQRFTQDRDEGPRGEDQPDMQRQGQAPREHQPRDEAQSRDEAQPRPRMDQRPPRQPEPAAFGMATIEPEDDYFSGPIETPESAGRPRDDAAPSRPRDDVAPSRPRDEAPVALVEDEFTAPGFMSAPLTRPTEAPVAEPAPAPVAEEPAAIQAEAPAEKPAKRPRTRRKAKVEPESEASTGDSASTEAQPADQV